MRFAQCFTVGVLEFKMKKSIASLHDKKRNHVPITMVTAYDYPTAQIEDAAGVDAILVGDSVGTNVLGYKSEQDVTMADMLHHLGAVTRGVQSAYVLVDLPFGSFEDPFYSYENAQQFLDRGADCVKIEGWRENKNIFAYLTGKGVAVCGHIGYNPQIHGPSPKVFGKDASQAIELIESAKVLEEAGAVMIVAEKIPEEICAIISSELKIPVIGIGSGRKCDGQVLVVHDILGFGTRVFRHARKYMDFRELAIKAISGYKQDVEQGAFPAEENVQHLKPEEMEKVKQELNLKI